MDQKPVVFGYQTPQTHSLSEMLAKAAAEVNARGNGQLDMQNMQGVVANPQSQYTILPPAGLPPVGKECAERLRKSAAATAEAIMAQAAERVSVAESVLEEAKALEEKARAIANDVLAQGEEAAKNAIKIATHQNELIDVLTATAQKHASQ